MDKLCHIVTNLELRHTGVTPHGPVLNLGNWSAMSTIRWLFLLLLIAFYIPSPRQVSNSATNPVFMAEVVVLDFLSTKLYSLDLWIRLLSVPLKILALQLGLRLNRLC